MFQLTSLITICIIMVINRFIEVFIMFSRYFSSKSDIENGFFRPKNLDSWFFLSSEVTREEPIKQQVVYCICRNRRVRVCLSNYALLTPKKIVKCVGRLYLWWTKLAGYPTPRAWPVLGFHFFPVNYSLISYSFF